MRACMTPTRHSFALRVPEWRIGPPAEEEEEEEDEDRDDDEEEEEVEDEKDRV
jgi:hypothetical protein